MKLEYFTRPASEQATIIRETAARRGLPLVMVEKDFWVSWMLAVLFAHPEFGKQLVFKGGTSLSKVFGAIERFSEDIDLSVNPEFLGISEEQVERAESRTKRTQRMNELEASCIERVRDWFTPELETIAREALGERSGGGPWMEFQVDAVTHSPVLLFHYPCGGTTEFEYLKRSVKTEFGSLTDQKPVGTHTLRPWAADEFPNQFEDFRCDAVVLELERTFWEKATILHAEYHRDLSKPIPDRFSRHYSDVAALSRHASASRAIADNELRQRVTDWKSRFFASTWSRYDRAVPGTFRLVPPEPRVSELERDYRAMRDMFLVEPPPFEQLLDSLGGLEKRINEIA